MNAVTLRLARPYSILIVHRRFGEHRQGLGLFESNRPDFLHRSLSGGESLAEPRERAGTILRVDRDRAFDAFGDSHNFSSILAGAGPRLGMGK